MQLRYVFICHRKQSAGFNDRIDIYQCENSCRVIEFRQEVRIMRDILIGTWAWGTGINGGSMVFGKKPQQGVKYKPENIQKGT